jgi:predicted esterase
MINKWIINEPIGNRQGCIIGLPGRNIPGEMMERFCKFMSLSNTLAIILEPHRLEWYPQPMGPDNQEEAVEGLKVAITELGKRIGKIQRAFRLRRNQIALMGFSAGAVMAIQVAAKSQQPFAAAVSLAGAILDPDGMSESQNQTPILLRHAIDDECFKWDERYLPMKNSLLEKNYNLYVSEKSEGGHGVSIEDAKVCGRFIAPHLGYNQEPKEFSEV